MRHASSPVVSLAVLLQDAAPSTSRVMPPVRLVGSRDTRRAGGGLCQQVLMNSQGMALNPIQSLYYVSPACLLCLSIPWTLVELPLLLERESWGALSPWVLLANAATAFALNLAGAWARGPCPLRPSSHTSREGA